MNVLADQPEVDLQFMRSALAAARLAAASGEVPVGALLTCQGREIACSGNRTIAANDPTAHAEIVVLRAASLSLGNYRLAGATLYVTIEPCAMCAGAMIQARIARLVYGAADPKGGAVHSCFRILDSSGVNHRIEVSAGLLAEEAAAVMQAFFASRR